MKTWKKVLLLLLTIPIYLLGGVNGAVGWFAGASMAVELGRVPE